MAYGHPAPCDKDAEPICKCTVFGQWDITEAITEVFSVAQAQQIADDALTGAYPWGAGEPANGSWVVSHGETIYHGTVR